MIVANRWTSAAESSLAGIDGRLDRPVDTDEMRKPSPEWTRKRRRSR